MMLTLTCEAFLLSDDDAVFNVVGEVLLAAHMERVLRDYYAGRLGTYGPAVGDARGDRRQV